MNTRSLTGIRFNTIVRHGEEVSVRLLPLVLGRIRSRSAGIAGGIKNNRTWSKRQQGQTRKCERLSVTLVLMRWVTCRSWHVPSWSWTYTCPGRWEKRPGGSWRSCGPECCPTLTRRVSSSATGCMSCHSAGQPPSEHVKGCCLPSPPTSHVNISCGQL